jgi:hypothetical protein
LKASGVSGPIRVTGKDGFFKGLDGGAALKETCSGMSQLRLWGVGGCEGSGIMTIKHFVYGLGQFDCGWLSAGLTHNSQFLIGIWIGELGRGNDIAGKEKDISFRRYFVLSFRDRRRD